MTQTRGRMRRLRRVLGEEGFSLVEALAAILLLSFMLLSLSAMAISGFRAVREVKFKQQATGLGTKAIEAVRALEYDAVTMVDADLVGDPRVLSTCAGFPPGEFFDPPGPLTCEEIVSSASAGPAGAVSPHITTETVQGTDYTVSRYVTWVDDTDPGGSEQSFRRLSTIVEWQSGGITRSFQTSTAISGTGRGVPKPTFELMPAAQSLDVEAGGTVVFPHGLTNTGTADTHDFTLEDLPTGWSFTLYRDEGVLGLYEPGIDTELVDTNANGEPDGGVLASGTSLRFLLVVEVPSDASNGSKTLTLTTISNLDPSVKQKAKDTVNVGGPGTKYYFHNNPTPPTGNTDAVKDLSMNETAPTAATLYRYSQNYHGADSGRFLDKSSPSATQGDTKLMANWLFQMPTTVSYDGQATVAIWVASKDFRCDKSLEFTVYLRQRTSTQVSSGNSGTLVNSAFQQVRDRQTDTAPCSYEKYEVNLGFTTTINSNDYIEVKIVVNSANSDDPGLFAYDTTAYPSYLQLPPPSG